MASEISNKSTKNEILDAYESLLKTVKEQKREAPQKAESEQKLKDQTIVSLRDKIKEQDLLIRQLTEKTTSAESSMKEIAIKALDSSKMR
ncbi:MAG: hypothetical protein WC865_13870, partial [Bacteroidales bacterium]